jgi:thioredoxin reductase (NADPH)
MKKADVVIIGAGPVGLFAVHQLGIKGLKAVVIDNLDKAGGQCIELYPDKPIYDIPAVPECTGEELTKNLLEQIKPFNTEFFYNERVDEVKQDKDNWIVKTNNKNEFSAPNIIIAGGVGSFEPRKLSTKDTERYEGKSIFYAVKNKDEFKNKNISIFGGGDSALDWTLELSKFSKITLIHRRNEFRGAPHTLSEIKKLENEGKISIKTPCQLESIEGDKNVESILIKFDDGKTEKIKTDTILSFFGLIMKLGPIAEWGLNMNKKTIEVNPENFETNKKGIFAAGDICSYPGKLKLILSGFHEVALASVECFKRARPNEKYRFEFTTASKTIQGRLGVEKKND